MSDREAVNTLYHSAAARYAAFQGADGEPFAIRVVDSDELAEGVPDFSYEWQEARLHCRAGEAVFSGVRHEYAFDSLLRMLFSWILLPRSGFLLHAATVVRNGRAFVFTGRSGAGKSTLASLAPEGSVLTDEISLLRCEEGGWRAYGTPFWGEFRAGDVNTSAPVAGIFRLVQAPENRVAPLRQAELLRVLLPNVLFFSAQPAAQRRLLEILGGAAEEIPGHDLEFRKERTVWEVLPA
ncbi:MAG: hypothetical protein LAN84_09000 [Acidobacteriia bacterium]|nr:hypothetical protein [Terriglobia bacterium]